MKKINSKVLANKLLMFLAQKEPNKKHCAFIEEDVCDACDERLMIVRFVLDKLKVKYD